MVQPVTEMTGAALGDLLAPGAGEYLDMFHDDAVFEFPYGLDGPIRKSGKVEMAAYLAELDGHVDFDPFQLDAVYPFSRGMVLEYRSVLHPRGGGEPYRQRYVAVIEVEDGRIGLYREYFDPLAAPGALAEALSSEPPRYDDKSPNGTLTSILKEALPNLAPATDFLGMLSDDAAIECPFAPKDAMRRLDGKLAIASYLERLGRIQQSAGMYLTGLYRGESNERAVLEYTGAVRNASSNEIAWQSYLAIISIQNGRLLYFTEYWNPIPVVHLFGKAGPMPQA